jgi:predicted aminopeptidase
VRQKSSSRYQLLSKSVFLFLCVLWLSGCATVGWYGQAAVGQLEMLCKREPIDRVLADPETPDALRERLETALEAREFAISELHLPDSRSYTYYADLERDAAVWNVVATPRFSMQAKTWCYPLVGCVAYRGYFRETAADRQARRLSERGLDTAVVPAVAYSTLGWFADPVLNTMLRHDEAWLAGLIFHELAHEALYVRDDTAFNEAYARLVEREGVRRWLGMRGEDDRLARWEDEQARQQAFIDLLLAARDELVELYRSQRPEAEMAAGKRDAFRRLRERIEAFAREHDTDRYRGWLEGDLNNAHLASVATYEAGVAAFARLLEERCEGDLACLHDSAAEMADWSRARRTRFLAGED